ncbi:hypothetical protein QBC47DRAFT_403106 [Echria macrotheca]|uniref:Uncharacterized protein n=1 Tax=Echria macrotheca TaxID=438768 RepID=A0AAJ0FB08_9PEZI|nr:hypothetical protein QBC47DRAFT_403106 [Echria macrotheca]
MCQYYAHAFLCKHTQYTFARFCRDANMIQTPCGDRAVWQTIQMHEACDDCKVWLGDSAAAAAAAAPGLVQRHRQGVRRSRS